MTTTIEHNFIRSKMVVNGWAVFNFWGVNHKERSIKSMENCLIKVLIEESKECNSRLLNVDKLCTRMGEIGEFN